MNVPGTLSRPLPAAAEPGGWMPRVTWDALAQGDNCPLCAELTAGVRSSADIHKVTDLRLSELRLAANQNVPGHCVLVCKRHVWEPYELSPEERGLFFGDMMATGLALEEVFQPIRLNFELLGNLAPHTPDSMDERGRAGEQSPGDPLDHGAANGVARAVPMSLVPRIVTRLTTMLPFPTATAARVTARRVLPRPRLVPSARFGNLAARYLAAWLTFSTIASAPSFVDA